MKIRILTTIIPILLNYFSSAQYSSTISGRIDGLGSGKKVILGNKPNGIYPSFNFIKYDSTISFNDSFRFKKIDFQYPVYYSLEFEGSKGWQSFFMDCGIITINGTADSIYKSKVRGSKNNEIIREYYNGLYNKWNTEHQEILKKLNSEKDSVANRKILDTVLLSMEHFRNMTIKFYENKVNKNPYPAFYILRNINLNNYSDSFVTAKFNMLPSKVKKSAPLEDIYYRLNLKKVNLRVGNKIPNFIFQNESKNKIDLYSLAHKYKLLVFGASWCGPCIEEIKHLDSLNKLFQKNGLAILAVNVDNTEDKWKEYSSNFKTKCIQLYTGNPNTSKIYKYFNIGSIPFMVLLDSKNQIIKNDIKIGEVEKYIK